MRPNKLRQLWSEGKTAINAWLTIPSAWSAELMAHSGFDSLTIDLQHGLADYTAAIHMLQAISTTNVVPMARIPWNDPAIIMRLLDGGAYGLICPMVNTRADVEAFINACRYPPLGQRSIGPTRALLYAGEDYLQHADETILTFVMVETEACLENLDEITSTPGLDGLYVGPADLSKSMGLEDLANFDNPRLHQAVERVLEACQKHGRIPGVHANTPENAVKLSLMGYRWVTPCNDTRLLQAGAANALKKTREGIN